MDSVVEVEMLTLGSALWEAVSLRLLVRLATDALPSVDGVRDRLSDGIELLLCVTLTLPLNILLTDTLLLNLRVSLALPASRVRD